MKLVAVNLTHGPTMKKILIIEDEAIISFSYRLQMERMGFEVTGTCLLYTSPSPRD